MNGLQKYFHELHVAKEHVGGPGAGSASGGSQREGSFCEGGVSASAASGPPVLSSEDQDELERILQESKRVMLTEREILAAQKARKETIRGEAGRRYDQYLKWLKEISAKQQKRKQLLQQMAQTRRRTEEGDLLEQVRRQVQSSAQQLEVSVQESTAACEFEKMRASSILQKSSAMLSAEKYDVQSFMDRQKTLREQQVGEFTDRYRESQRQGPPGVRHRSVAMEALSFIRKAQVLERVRQGELPDAATYHSLAEQGGTQLAALTSPRKWGAEPTVGRVSASIATPRLATKGRVILQPQRPLDPWQLR